MKRKNIIKKLSMLFITSCIIAGMFVFVGCKNGEEASFETPKNALSLNKSTLELATYETFRLRASDAPEGSVWTSSNESVAKVEDGNVIACGVGETTITLKNGEREANCIVYVVKNTLTPTIESDLDRTNNLFLGNEYQMSFDTVLFDGKSYETEFSYESSDNSVITVSDTGLVKAESIGSAFITVKTEWRGCLLADSYLYEVLDNERIVNIAERNIVLYSTSVQDFSNRGQIEAQLVEDGKIVSGELSYESSDPAIAEVSSTGEITAKKDGEATVSVTGSVNGKEFPVQTVWVRVEIPVIDNDNVLKLNKTRERVKVLAAEIFGNDDLEISRVVRSDTDEEVPFADGNLDISLLDYGYHTLIYYTESGQYGVKTSTYVAPPAGTLLLSSDEFVLQQVASCSVDKEFDTDIAWEKEGGSLRLINNTKSWISKISFKVDNIEEYEYIYFRIFAGDKEGGYLYGYGDKRISKKLSYGWNSIVLQNSEFNSWYTETTGEVTLGYTNGPQNNYPDNKIDDAWISNIYGVNKIALEEMIASLDETLVEEDALRVEEICQFFALLSDKNIVGKDSFITKLRQFDGAELSQGELVSATNRVGLVQLSTNATMSFDQTFAHGEENGSIKIYNNDVSWVTTFSFEIADISKYEEISFYIYIENETGGLIYDSAKTRGKIIELEKGWNEVKVSKDRFDWYYDETTKTFTMNYTSYNADKSNQNSYQKSIWLSTVTGKESQI